MQIYEHELNSVDISVYKFASVEQAARVLESVSTFKGIKDVQLKSRW